MKNILIIFALFTLGLPAQDGISVALLQDVKLGLGMDKAHGNTSPTLDVLASLTLEGKQFTYHYFSVQAQYEHANLSSGYFSRYSVNALWNYNQLILENLEFAYGFGLGMINRKHQEGLGSYSGTIELSYKIAKRWGVVLKNEWVRRPDLQTPKTAYNLSLGLKLKLVEL